MAKKKVAKLSDAQNRSASKKTQLNDATPHEETGAAVDLRSDSEAIADYYGIKKDIFKAIEELKHKLNFEEKVVESDTSVRSAGGAYRARPVDKPVELDNILCFGTGYKDQGGFETPYECVKVYVRRKVMPQQIDEGLIPKEIGGIPTDVEVLPPVEYRGQRYKCGEGMCLAPHGGVVEVGTIGCLCARDGDLMLLTNNHVAADFDRADSDLNSGGNGAKIFQYPDMTWIGNLYDFAPLARNYVDVDAALVHTSSKVIESRHRNYDMAKDMGTVSVGDEVVKDGYTTIYTQARFKRLIFDMPVPVPGFGTARHRVVQVFDGYFSDGGDSGSIIARKDNKRPVGLLWGGPQGNPYVTYASPIDTVKQVMGIDYFLAAGDI